MKHFLMGFLVGVLVATAGLGVAQMGGTTFTYGDDPDAMVAFSSNGVHGTIFTYEGSGVKAYSDSTGRLGTIFTYPGSGVSALSFTRPCP